MIFQGGSLVLVGFAGWEVLTFKSVEPALYTLGIELKDFFSAAWTKPVPWFWAFCRFIFVYHNAVIGLWYQRNFWSSSRFCFKKLFPSLSRFFLCGSDYSHK